MKSEDRDIREAFAALDRTVPDGYWDDFSSRVLARLENGEADDMERDLAEGQKPEEHSGLHEIQALASTTRRRLSQRLSSESEADESLLLSSSSGALRAVALPDPNQTGDSGVRPTTLRAKATSPGVALPAERREARSAAPFWIVGGVATLAAAAAVAVFVFGIGTRSPTGDEGRARRQTLARADLTPAEAGAAQATSAPTAAPAAAAPAPVARSLDESTQGAADQGGVAAASDHFAEPPPADGARGQAGARHDAVIAAGGEKSVDEAKVAKTKDDHAHTARGQHRESAAAGHHSSTEGAAPTGGATGGKDNARGGGATPAGDEEGEDLDKVLDQVTGKVHEPTAPVQKKPRAPAKKELDRRDVAQAMAGVKSAAQRCHGLEAYEGTVSVHFVVAPTGHVTRAAAVAGNTGRTGGCVAAAVKQAHFPAFDGPPMSFTYPFLLSE